MKTIELTREPDISQKDQIQEFVQQPIIVTLGNKPVAALLPMMDDIAHLSKFKQVIEPEETITLTVDGQPIAILQPLVPLVTIDDEDVDLEAVVLSTNPKFLNLIEQSRQRHQTEGGISSDEMRQRLGL
jgi:antitoxin (DNA-binding transcriptional repressor) of toxin-antitoxin stability system